MVRHRKITKKTKTSNLEMYKFSTPVLSSFMIYHWVRTANNTTGATCGSGPAYPSGAHELTLGV